MGTNPVVDVPPASPPRFLSRVRLFVALGLLLLLILCLAWSWFTSREFTGNDNTGGKADTSTDTLVDISPWRTAQALAAFAATTEELQYARDAERLADHAVDQAFSSALRQATTRKRALAGEALALSQKVAELQRIVKEDEARVQSISQPEPPAANNPEGADPVATDLDIAKAQLGLDSDQLNDAQQDLARAAGDERGKIQQELAAHESSMRVYDAHAHNEGEVSGVVVQRYNTLASRLQAWLDQRAHYPLIQEAMQQALADAAALAATHDQLKSQAAASSAPAADKTAELVSLKDRSARTQLLGIYDDRIQTEKQLAAVYSKWSAQVLVQKSIVLHLLLQSFALIAFILLGATLFDALVRHLMLRPNLDRRRAQTLRIILVLGIQVVSVLLILFVIFGFPNQMPTILGLATAGLTVAFQDFIIAFLGWFVLVGKNGIRVGDWVEINGVGGEVVEIGLFRTAMLETGNWTDKGHPTGRRITFINSFAIKGQYFNFSTTGQWMWDEIAVNIPTDDDTYATIDRIREAVLKATENDARLAEQEWKRVTRHDGLSQFTASPAVDMRPSVSGISIIVRYVTRASDRFEMRNRLYQCVIDLLHKNEGNAASGRIAPAQKTTEP